jgi:hypothetical protein
MSQLAVFIACHTPVKSGFDPLCAGSLRIGPDWNRISADENLPKQPLRGETASAKQCIYPQSSSRTNRIVRRNKYPLTVGCQE